MKKIVIAVMLIVMSGCFYIRQDWDMYDNQRNQQMSLDAGKE